MRRAETEANMSYDLRKVARLRGIRLGDEDARRIASALVSEGWGKPEPEIRQDLLAGKAMVVDRSDPQADEYFVYGFDGFGHDVLLERTGHHPEAALVRQVQQHGAESRGAAGPRYDPIWMVRVLAVHGDGSVLWR